MINEIGGYIFTIFVLAYVQQRPSLRKGEEGLRKLPVLAHWAIIAVCIALILQRYGEVFKGFAPIAWGNVVFDSLNLWMHEAGHFYFSWGGEFLHSLGGTLLELGVPAGFAAFCFVCRRNLLLSLMLFWFGYNCFSVSRYIADAAERKLDLFGASGPEGHDWGNMLGSLNLLAYDDALGRLVMVIGWAAVVVGVGLYLATLYRQDEAATER